MTERTKVLVLGASGMLGGAVFRLLCEDTTLRVHGSVRSESVGARLPIPVRERIVPGVDVENTDTLVRVFEQTLPQVVINCVGLVKQLAHAEEPLVAVPINSLLPHRLARLCALIGARLVHISTDCVFSGTRGSYREMDAPDAQDLYGRSKLIGEVVDQPHALTLRTSIIGHELASAHGLIEWFLSQTESVRGFTKAIFSGLPTVELASVIRDHVLPNRQLHGLYHVAAAPIDKYALLQVVARCYGKTIEIVPDDRVRIDRSLDASRFRAATGYVAPDWRELVRRMRAFG